MRIIIAGIALLVATLSANAWFTSRDSSYNISIPIVIGCSPAACPGDLTLSSISAWKAWYSTGRCFTFAYSGNVVDFADALTGTTTGTRIACSGGVASVVVSSSACTFITGGACSPLATTCPSANSCEVATIYDQTGGAAGNITDTHASSNRPLVLTNALNSTPCIIVPTSTKTFVSANPITQAQPFTMSIIGKENGVGAGIMSLFGNASNTIRDGFDNTAAPNNNHSFYTGSSFPLQAQTNNAWHAFNDVFDHVTTSTSGILSTDGSAATGLNLGNSNGFSASAVRLVPGIDPAFIAWGCEFGLAAGSMSTTDIGTLNANQHAAYGGW